MESGPGDRSQACFLLTPVAAVEKFGESNSYTNLGRTTGGGPVNPLGISVSSSNTKNFLESHYVAEVQWSLAFSYN